ncbi:MAG: glycosyltransferase family 2 protein [Candidatus Hodarchaeota archaeon]
MEKLVSVAIATYNGEKFLKEQLDSIYKQTYKNIEVVVSDDCSIDGTVKILDEYKQKFGLKYSVNEQNLGVVKNFERAISRCQGEYIALADQDDIWLPEKIQILVDNIRHYSLVCSCAYLIDQNKGIIRTLKWNEYGVPTKKENQFQVLAYRNFVAGCTSLFKRNLLSLAFPIPKGMSFHDWWFALVASKMNGVKHLNSPLLYHRQHWSNLTDKIRNPYWKRVISFIIDKQQCYKRVQFKKAEYNRLKAMLSSSIFNKAEKEYLKEALEYYKNFFESFIPLKAVAIWIKNRHILYPYPNIRGFIRKWTHIFIPFIDSIFHHFLIKSWFISMD